jgi:phosphoribosylformylglycinamidine cyclo-ligase
MVLSVAAGQADSVQTLLQEQGETVYRLGQVTEGEGMRYTGSLL